MSILEAWVVNMHRTNCKDSELLYLFLFCSVKFSQVLFFSVFFFCYHISWWNKAAYYMQLYCAIVYGSLMTWYNFIQTVHASLTLFDVFGPFHPACPPQPPAPSYLAETLHSTADVGSRRRLRSASTSTLVIPTTRRTALGDRAFPVTAARAWNALPSSDRSAPSLLQFRRDLKTALHVSVIVLFTIVFGRVTDCNP